MSGLDIVGWISSILVVWSLMQARVLRFRVDESDRGRDGHHRQRHARDLAVRGDERGDHGHRRVLDLAADPRAPRRAPPTRWSRSASMTPTFATSGACMPRTWRRHIRGSRWRPPRTVPAPAGSGAAAGRSAYLVLRGDETVGMVVVRDAGAGVGEVELDYVTERFRDFTPGEFVYRRSGYSPARGSPRWWRTPAGHERPLPPRRLPPVGDHWERPVEPAA